MSGLHRWQTRSVAIGLIGPDAFTARRGVEMPIGFVFIRAAPAREQDVHEKMSMVKEIVELHPLFGEYDMLVKVEAEDPDRLGRIVVDKIRRIPGVTGTQTLAGMQL
jgi:DNA-binding Lrp family transcriptional regulator